MPLYRIAGSSLRSFRLRSTHERHRPFALAQNHCQQGTQLVIRTRGLASKAKSASTDSPSSMVAVTDQILFDTPVDEVAKLPPDILKEIVRDLRLKYIDLKTKDDAQQAAMLSARGHYRDAYLISPTLPSMLKVYEWHSLYHDLDSMPEPFPGKPPYDYDGWKAEHGDDAAAARQRDEAGEHELAEGEESIYERWYSKQEEFAATWSYGTLEDTQKVIQANREDEDFRVHADRVCVQNNGNVVAVDNGGNDSLITARGLKWRDHISSQLLLYRLVVVFGMPPNNDTDGYKQAWDVTLVHKSGNATLNLYDWKGGSSFAIHASGEELKDALSLLTHLISDRCLHSYDCCEAGALA